MGNETLNRIEETTVSFGSITSEYTTALTLSAGYNLYSHALIESSLDQSITLKFENTDDEKIINAETNVSMDVIQINGAIKIKHNGVAPSIGSILITAW